jgi:dihydrofolate reductase
MNATTRPLISAMQVGLDGNVLGPDRQALDFVDSWADGLELLPPVDAFILGGGMLPEYTDFWTAVKDDPKGAADMLGRDPYPRELAYATLAAQTPHLVLSTTLETVDWPSGRIVRDLDEIAELRRQKGQAVYVVGGPGLIASLIDAGLLDELRLIVHPFVTGDGTALFGGVTGRQALDLVSASSTDAGRVNLTYRLGAPSRDEDAS